MTNDRSDLAREARNLGTRLAKVVARLERIEKALAPRLDPHDVKFHIGTGTVVCTCGDYFESDQAYGAGVWHGKRTAVNRWAEHVRSTLGGTQ